jgi:hypothetical protein
MRGGISMAITGSGTQADPYIVTTWSELITDRDNSSYVEWHGGDLDFNNINDGQGFNGSVTIKGNVDFKGATFRNFYSRASTYPKSCLNFDFPNNGYTKNLSLLNCLLESVSLYHGIRFGNNENSNVYHTEVTNVRISGKITSLASSVSNTAFLYFDRRHSYAGETIIQSCSFNFECDLAQNVQFAGVDADFQDCRIKTKVKTGSTTFDRTFNNSQNTYKNCMFEGSFINKNGDPVSLANSASSANMYLFTEGTYTTNSNNANSVYDKDTCTMSGNGVTGLHTSEFKDKSALQAAGFPVV